MFKNCVISYQFLCGAQWFSSNYSTRVTQHMTFTMVFHIPLLLKTRVFGPTSCGHFGRNRKEKDINLEQFCLWTLKLISCCENFFSFYANTFQFLAWNQIVLWHGMKQPPCSQNQKSAPKHTNFCFYLIKDFQWIFILKANKYLLIISEICSVFFHRFMMISSH